MITEIKNKITHVIARRSRSNPKSEIASPCGLAMTIFLSIVFSFSLAFAAQDYIWKVTDTQYGTKIERNYKGINDGLTWVREMAVCSGGFNGSADYQRFDNSGLQRYRVIGKKDSGKQLEKGVIFHTGDLVFPDDTVWYKSEGYAKAHYAGELAWELATDNSDIDDCENKDAQYEYARNLPSALAIADAWDGVKNLISGPAGTHKEDDGYYADNAKSWHRNIGNGQGKSRLATIEEYQKARGDEASLMDSLLYGTGNYPRYQWSGEQGDATYGYGSRTYSAEKGVDGGEVVTYPFAGCWVVEK